MLNDYIEMYMDAKANGETDKIETIERELVSLGMDKVTLSIIASEFANTERT